MTAETTDVPIRRPFLSTNWEQLRGSDLLKHLLEEFALWTALWAGLPLSDELDRRNPKGANHDDA